MKNSCVSVLYLISDARVEPSANSGGLAEFGLARQGGKHMPQVTAELGWFLNETNYTDVDAFDRCGSNPEPCRQGAARRSARTCMQSNRRPTSSGSRAVRGSRARSESFSRTTIFFRGVRNPKGVGPTVVQGDIEYSSATSGCDS